MIKTTDWEQAPTEKASKLLERFNKRRRQVEGLIYMVHTFPYMRERLEKKRVFMEMLGDALRKEIRISKLKYSQQ